MPRIDSLLRALRPIVIGTYQLLLESLYGRYQDRAALSRQSLTGSTSVIFACVDDPDGIFIEMKVAASQYDQIVFDSVPLAQSLPTRRISSQYPLE